MEAELSGGAAYPPEDAGWQPDSPKPSRNGPCFGNSRLEIITSPGHQPRSLLSPSLLYPPPSGVISRSWNRLATLKANSLPPSSQWPNQDLEKAGRGRITPPGLLLLYSTRNPRPAEGWRERTGQARRK